MERIAVNLDEKITNNALKITGYKKIESLIEDALKEFILRKNCQKLLKLKGQIHWEGNLDDLRRSRI